MKKILLNSVVITTDSAVVDRFADTHNAISAEHCARLLIGYVDETWIKTNQSVVTDMFMNMLRTKLQLGERVIVHDTGILKYLVKDIKHHAYMHGFRVYRIGAVDRRDGIEIVIEDEFQIIEKKSLADSIKAKNGCLIIPDVHGCYNELDYACEYARSMGMHILFLGDIIDYGRNNVAVTQKVKYLIDSGAAHAICGNHENKIYRYFAGKSITISHGNRVTIEEYNALSETKRVAFRSQFMAMYNQMHSHLTFGNIGFAHAAFIDKWDDNSQKTHNMSSCIYGEVVEVDSANVRMYNWVDSLAYGQTVYVGHDIRSKTNAFEHESNAGGKAVFLDTGCGKGGILTTAHIDSAGQFVKYVQF